MTGADMSNMTRRIFTFQVKTQVELMIYKNAEASRVSSLMSIENQRLIDEALNPGKGILLLSAHLGDISLGVTRLAAAGYPVYVITRVLSNPYLYASPGLNDDMEIFSYGVDGVRGGEGINKDIESWNLD